ncbi:efflux RND transporter periplasmic adaptor subunit [bacterium]|nr:efflux RND transporter periplasmic adaptor subunit [bacterium]
MLNTITNRKSLISGILILVVSFFGMKFLASLKKEIPTKDFQTASLLVKTTTVNLTTTAPKIQAYGRILSGEPIELIAEINGKIEKGDFELKAGQKFQKGALILQVDSREAKLDLLTKRNELLNSISKVLPELQLDFPESYKTWEKYLNSFDLETETKPLPETKNQKELVVLARYNVLTTFYGVKKLEISYSKYFFKADFDGAVTEVFVTTGSTIRSGNKIAKIIRTDKFEVKIPLAVSEISYLEKNSEVEISSKNLAKIFKGKISRIASNLDQANQTVDVFVTLQNPENIFEGDFLLAKFIGKEVPNSVEILRKAVYDGNFVYVIEEGKLKKREVKIAKFNEKTAIVSQGLQNGEVVLNESISNPYENLPVRINN